MVLCCKIPAKVVEISIIGTTNIGEMQQEPEGRVCDEKEMSSFRKKKNEKWKIEKMGVNFCRRKSNLKKHARQIRIAKFLDLC